MQQAKYSHDVFYKSTMTANSLSSAMNYCAMNGWGFDITLPKFRWHAKKSYAENFKWKGHPKASPEID